MGDKQKYLLLIGVLLLAAGTGLYLHSVMSGPSRPSADLAAREVAARNSLREADEYLRQNSVSGARRAQVILTAAYSDETLPLEINQLARYGLAVALEKQGERSAALGHFRALKEKGVHSPRLTDRVDFSLGRLLLRINHDAEGRALLQALLARSTELELKSRIHTALGAHDLRKGRSRSAAENFAIAMKYNPDNLQAELGRARAKRGGGRTGMAFDYYDDYLTGTGNLDPRGRVRVEKHLKSEYYHSGVAAYRSGEYGRAIYLLDRALKAGLDPVAHERILYLLADSNHQKGNRKRALQLFNRVLSNSESSMDQPALIKKGILRFQDGHLKEAAALFLRAETGYPKTIYTDRAREWRREAETLIRENSRIFDENEEPSTGRRSGDSEKTNHSEEKQPKGKSDDSERKSEDPKGSGKGPHGEKGSQHNPSDSPRDRSAYVPAEFD